MSDIFPDFDWDAWAETIWADAGRILVTVAIIFITLRIVQRLIVPTVRMTVATEMAGQPQVDVDKRVATLTNVANRTLSVIAVVIALLTILPTFGINVGALIAGAGVAGIAIGLGAQTLVRDVLSGTFILLENQYGRGDVVGIAGVHGVVEDVNLRRTQLRDMDGTVHTIPHSAITVASNQTRALSRVNMVVAVQHGSDLNEVFTTVNRVGEEISQDPQWQAAVTSPPKVLGVDEFRPGGIAVRIQGDTAPSKQWDVMREMRLRLSRAFDTAGIKLATS